MSQVATVSWVDPIVGIGQAALATLNVYAALDGSSPLIHLGDVNPGVQTLAVQPGPLTPGSSYYFCVKATDVNGLQGQQSNWAGPLGPVGVPGAPTNASATLG